MFSPETSPLPARRIVVESLSGIENPSLSQVTSIGEGEIGAGHLRFGQLPPGAARAFLDAESCPNTLNSINVFALDRFRSRAGRSSSSPAGRYLMDPS